MNCKIAILTHFSQFIPSYALAVGWLERARMFEFFDQDFDVLVNENCPKNNFPHQRECLKTFDSKEPFERRVEFFVEHYKDILAPYDIIMTADLIYQHKGNFLAWNAAMRLVNDYFKSIGKPKFWLHWIHSGWISRPRNPQYPESLRHSMMDDSFIVYMNKSEANGAASMYGTGLDNIRCVYNPKDPRSFFEMHPLVWEVTQKLDIPNKDVVQVFPHCSTRMHSKGINEVVAVHAAIKRQGKSVALVMANANARQVPVELDMQKVYMEKAGLEYGKDVFFTSDLTEDKQPFPRKAVSDMFRLSNLFAFGSWREVCPNVLLEAKISDNLLVVNKNLPCAKEFAAHPRTIYMDTTSKIPGRPDGKNDRDIRRIHESYWDDLARKILEVLPSRKHMWEYGYNTIWSTQMYPLIQEAMFRLRGKK